MPNEVLLAETVTEAAPTEETVCAGEPESLPNEAFEGESAEEEAIEPDKFRLQPNFQDSKRDGFLGEALAFPGFSLDFSLLMKFEAAILAGLGLFLFFLPEAGTMIRATGYIAYVLCLMVLAF